MKSKSKILVVLLTIVVVGTGLLFGIYNARRKSEKALVVATNFPAYDFARSIVGDAIEVKMLVSPGTEIHDFEPTPGDIIDIKNSKLFIYNGGESENWVEEILGNLDKDKTTLFKMMDVVDVVEEEVVEGMEVEHNHEEEEIEYDEHIWTSIKNAEKILEKLKEELERIFPEEEKRFEKNAKEYIDKLAELDLKFQHIVENGKRKFLVFGDRFPLRYFADDYGLDYFAAFPGCAEQTEVSSKTIAFLTDKVKSENVPVILKIELSNGEIARTIADETGAKVLTFNTLHNISASDFESGRSYVEMMEENIKVLEEALN